MRIFLALFVIFIVVLLFKVSDNKMSKKNKILLSFCIIAVTALAYIYEENLAHSEGRNLQLLTSFNQGKVLVCNDINVSNTKFNYEFGTGSFVAKREFKELSSIKLEISDCEIAK